MNLFEKLLAENETAVNNYVATVDISHIYKDFFNWSHEILQSLETYVQTKDVNVLTEVFQNTAISDVKENVEPNLPSNERRRTRRTQRGAAQNMETASISNTAVKIKREKISLAKVQEQPSEALDITVKSENEEMPAPKRPAPKTKKGSKMKVKKEKAERSSDVVLCVPEVATVNLLEMEEEAGVEQTMRVTRTKTRKLKETHEKRVRESSNEEDFESKTKKTKSDVTQTTNVTFYDAQSQIETSKDVSMLVSQMNATVVLEKPTMQHVIPESIMTDDDSASSSNEVNSLFRNFSPIPVKRKIEQYEKLQKDALKVRGEKSLTTAFNTAIPKAITSTGKKRPNVPYITGNQTLSKSAVKNSGAEMRALDERRREKEEMAKKREAVRQAEMEEKKRRREEREQKVQQQRVALENEKKKQLEAQMLKDEDRRKQIAAEKEKKSQKEEKKKMVAKSKITEDKLMEVNKTEAAIRKQTSKEKEDRPLFMRTKAPLLPTDDCYDSDEEAPKTTKKKRKSSWDDGEILQRTLLNQQQIQQELINSFFVRQTTTPDLIEVFEKIESRKLKRTSSAVWLKPPRYTMIHNLEDYLEE